MKSVKSKLTRALPIGSQLAVCDNSGAKVIEIMGVKNHKTVKGRRSSASVYEKILATVKRGKPEMRKQVVFAVIVRQKKEYKRANGLRVKFEDNAAVVLKDDKGNPKGTIFKGAIAKEVTERWPAIAKVARIVV